MCGIICSATTLAIGAVLVAATSIFSFIFLPDVVKSVIRSETVLIDDTIQMERFEELPFPVNFTVRIFNVTNVDEITAGGVPVVTELGPYTYKLYQSREILATDDETITYRRWERFEFDPVASYPNTEEDMVTVINVPYFAIIQMAEVLYPNLAAILGLAMNGIFGEHNRPFSTFKVQDLLFSGVPLCRSPGLFGGIACGLIAEIAALTKNIEVYEDGSMAFTVLDYKARDPSEIYNVSRGVSNSDDLGLILSFANEIYFNYWTNIEGEDGEETPSVCNMINGTDAGIFAPFVDKDRLIYAINTDICRSVELRYESEEEYEGIPTLRFSAKEWLFDNDDGCYCLNVTSGINREDGCLLKGGMEMYSCVGAMLVLSYPHFLYADPAYRDGVVGMQPDPQLHEIYMDLEPHTGTPIRGAKRAQFNIFMRPVSSISPTQPLSTILMPFLWVEEGINLPEEFVDELTNKLLRSLRLMDILVPVLIAACCLVTVIGLAFTIRAKTRKPGAPVNTSQRRA